VRCLKPKYIKNQGIWAPCGRCINCKLQKANNWATRCLHESNYHEHNMFVTLTYDTAHLPLDESVHKHHFQNFMKRLRHQTRNTLKYLACGHYGDQNGRPHYHAILYGLEPLSHELGPPPAGTSAGHQVIKGPLTNAWKYGIVHIGTVTYQSARYVAQYLLHGHRPPGKAPVFLTMSKGMGERWIKDNLHLINQETGITINGTHVSIPRYYHQKIKEIQGEKPVEITNRQMLEARQERDQKILGHEATTQEDWETIIIEQGRDNLQKAKNVQSRHRLYKAGKETL
jgi:hypothetical protein